MKFFTNPNFYTTEFYCPHCKSDSHITVHEDGSTMCASCGAEPMPPISYHDAKKITDDESMTKTIMSNTATTIKTNLYE